MARTRAAAQAGFTTRFRAEDAGWIAQHAQQLDCSLNDVVRGLVQDHRTLFRLPSMMVATLDTDRGNRSIRQYLIDLLTARYADLIERRPRRRRPSPQI
jgi:hypothetical protein